MRISNNILQSEVACTTDNDLAVFVSTFSSTLATRKSFDGNHTIHVVSLPGQGLSDESVRMLVPIFLKAKAIQCLFLPNNQLNNDDARVLSRCFAHMPELVAVDVSNNEISEAGAVDLCRELLPRSASGDWNRARSLRQILYYLNLSNNPVRGTGCFSIAECVKCNSSAVVLGLGQVNCDSAGVIALSAGLPNLRGLDLSGNELEGDLRSLEALASVLPSCRVLQELNMGNLCSAPSSRSSSIDAGLVTSDQTLHAFVSGLLHNLQPAVEQKPSEMDNPSSAFLFVLARTVTPRALNCINLRALGLAGNHLGEDGINALSAAFAVGGPSSHLEELDLSRNLIRSTKPITALLISCPSIRAVYLAGNIIPDDEASSLVESVLKTPIFVEALSLAHNELTDHGACCLADMLCEVENSTVSAKRPELASAIQEAYQTSDKFNFLWRGEAVDRRRSTCRYSRQTILSWRRILLAGRARHTSFLEDLAFVWPSELADGERIGLTLLDFSGNRLSEVGASALANALEVPSCSIQFLDVRGCGTSTNCLEPLRIASETRNDIHERAGDVVRLTIHGLALEPQVLSIENSRSRRQSRDLNGVATASAPNDPSEWLDFVNDHDPGDNFYSFMETNNKFAVNVSLAAVTDSEKMFSIHSARDGAT